MNVFHRPRPGRRQAEQLLDGVGRPSDAALAGLLDAVRRTADPGAAGLSGELPGERAALAAFRAGAAARAGGTPAEEITPVRRTPSRLLALAAAGALTLTGGVAFAATGGLAGDPPRSDRRADGAAAPASSGSTGRPASPGTSPTGRPSDTGSGKPSALRPGLDERAALLVACAAWTRSDGEAGSDHGKGMRADLVAAAGGAAAVPALCAALIDELCPDDRPGADGTRPATVPGAVPGCPKPGPTTSDRPTDRPTAKPSKPATKPTDKGTGKPSEAPDGKPTDRATRRPTDAPTDVPTAQPSTTP